MSANTDVTRDPYVLLVACLTFHKLPPELRKAIKECVDARSVAPVASEEVEVMCERLEDWRKYLGHDMESTLPEAAALLRKLDAERAIRNLTADSETAAPTRTE